jgi:hypothetical protein
MKFSNPTVIGRYEALLAWMRASIPAVYSEGLATGAAMT